MCTCQPRSLQRSGISTLAPVNLSLSRPQFVGRHSHRRRRPPHRRRSLRQSAGTLWSKFLAQLSALDPSRRGAKFCTIKFCVVNFSSPLLLLSVFFSLFIGPMRYLRAGFDLLVRLCSPTRRVDLALSPCPHALSHISAFMSSQCFFRG